MVISVIYILSLIILFMSFLYIKKSEKKLNIIYTILLQLVFIFCYNSIISYFLNLFYIKVNLISLSLVNIITTVILIINIKKNKKKQEYYFHCSDLILTILSLLIIILIFYFRFGFPFNIVYETSDPGVHFWTSLDFFENSKLLNHVTNTAVDFSTRQFASYANLGILFKIFNPFLGKIYLSKIYVLFDLATLFMSLNLFYILVKISNKNINKIFIFLLSILYMLGYPLNNIIFGFFYSGHAINIIILLLIIFKLYKQEYFSNKIFILILCIINLTLFFTYYFYVPIIYGAEFIYFIYQNKVLKRKIINKNLCLDIIYTMIIPLILGVAYFVIPNIGNNDTNIITQIGLDGYYYNNAISNFILFLPFTLYYFIFNIKNKKFNLLFNMLSLSLLFLLFLYILVFFDIVSLYYVSKVYYLLWLELFIISIHVCNKLFEKNKTLILSFIIIYIFLCINSVFGLENMIINQNKLEINKREVANILDVYNYNFEKIRNSKSDYILTNKELDILNDIYRFKPTNVIINYGIRYQKVWIDAYFWKEKVTTTENKLYDYIFNGDYISLDASILDTIQNSKYDNFLLFYRQGNYNKLENYYLLNNYFILNANNGIAMYNYDNAIFIRKD